MAGKMIFEQLTGPRRRIELRGRSMPYRPITLTSMQRVTTTWMPAAIKGVQQVLGPSHEPTTFTGTWKDKFLARDENSVTLINFPRLSPAASGVPGFASATNFVGTSAFPGTQDAKLARVVRDAFEKLKDEGQDIRWQWDQFVRYGKITRLTDRIGEPTGGADNIGWDLECTWSGKIAVPPLLLKQTVNLLTTAQGLAKLLQGLTDVLDALEQLSTPNAFVNSTVPKISSLGDTVSSVISLLRDVVSIVDLPADIAQTIAGQLQQIRREAEGLRRDIDTIGSAGTEAAKVGRADSVAIAALVQAALRSRITELASFAAEQQRLLALFQGPELLGTFVADGSTSLRDAATKYYGTPDEWVRISNYNSIYSTTAAAGTIVLVPAIS